MIIRLTSTYSKMNVYINMDKVEYFSRDPESQYTELRMMNRDLFTVDETPEYIYEKLRGGKE